MTFPTASTGRAYFLLVVRRVSNPSLLWCLDILPIVLESLSGNAPEKIYRTQHGRRAFGGRQEDAAAFVFLFNHAAFMQAA